jgi:S-methylmethionine-dependent homocysteine/selenocysteine methylase
MTGCLRERLERKRPLLLDGALGTELERRGVESGLPLWSANALTADPDALLRLHSDYCAAGADLLTTDTFRTTRRTFRRAGIPDRSAELTALAVHLARTASDAAGSFRPLVCGSIGPLEDCYRPDLVPADAELHEEHAEHASRLAAAGVDLLMLETFGTAREAAIALEEALRTGLETTVSLLCRPDGRLYSGEDLADAVAALLPLGPAALLVNCLPPAAAEPILLRLRKWTRVPLGVYANVGRSGEELSGRLVRAVDSEAYARFALRWAALGASLIGGCCGTGPRDIRLISEALQHAA